MALDQATEQTRHELPASATRIPIAIWSRLRFDLAPYLTERAAVGANVLTFYHRQVAEWVQEHFAKAFDQTWQAHQRLADYFRSLADPERNQSWKGESARPFLELTFHLARGDIDRIPSLLLDFAWLLAKTRKRLVYEMIQDFDDSLNLLPVDHSQRKALEFVRGAVRLSAILLLDDSNLLPSQLLGRMSYFHEPALASLMDAARDWRAVPWLRPVRSTLLPPGTPLQQTFRGHAHPVTAVAVSSDDRLLVSGDSNGSIKVWNLVNGQYQQTRWIRDLPVSALAIDSNGLVVAGLLKNYLFCEKDQLSCITASWDSATGRVLEKEHSGQIRAMAVTPGGLAALVIVQDLRNSGSTVQVWDMKTDQQVASFIDSRASVRTVAFLAEDRFLATGADDGALNVWEIESGRQRRLSSKQTNQKKALVNAITGSRDGRLVAAVIDGDVTVWDLQGSECLDQLWESLDWIAMSSDGRVMVTTTLSGGLALRRCDWILDYLDGRLDADKSVDEWETSRTCPTAHWMCGADITAIALSQGGQVVCGSTDRTLRVWSMNVEDQQELPSPARGYIPRETTVLPDTHLAISDECNEISIWEVKTGCTLGKLSQKYWGQVTALTMSQERDLAVVCVKSGGFQVWDTARNQLLWSSAEPRQSYSFPFIIDAVALTQGSSHAVVGWRGPVSSCYHLSVWDLEKRQELKRLFGCAEGSFAECGKLTSMAVTPDGRIAVLGVNDGGLYQWDLSLGKLVRVLCKGGSSTNGNPDNVWTAIAVSPNGQAALSGGTRGDVRVWNLLTGEGAFFASSGIIWGDFIGADKGLTHPSERRGRL